MLKKSVRQILKNLRLREKKQNKRIVFARLFFRYVVLKWLSQIDVPRGPHQLGEPVSKFRVIGYYQCLEVCVFLFKSS